MNNSTPRQNLLAALHEGTLGIGSSQLEKLELPLGFFLSTSVENGVTGICSSPKVIRKYHMTRDIKGQRLSKETTL